MVSTRRTRLSHDIICGPSGSVTVPASAARMACASTVASVASVLFGSLLPLAARQREVAEQRREHLERDHRNGYRRAFAEVGPGDAALEGEGGHQMRRVDRPAAGNGVNE